MAKLLKKSHKQCLLKYLHAIYITNSAVVIVIVHASTSVYHGTSAARAPKINGAVRGK